MPIVDLSIPRREQVETFVQDLRQRLERSEVIYLHCWGGRGRAGMSSFTADLHSSGFTALWSNTGLAGLMAACSLVQLYGISADEALFRVQSAFDSRGDFGDKCKSPETAEQIKFVRDYAQRCSEQAAPSAG